MSEKNGIEELGGERGSVQVVTVTSPDVELFIEPLFENRDSDGEAADVLPDELAELEVTRIWHQSDGAGSFFLHNGNGTAIGPTYTYTANPGRQEPGCQKMGLGNRIACSATITSGTLRIYVEVKARRPVYRKRATQYPDA